MTDKSVTPLQAYTLGKTVGAARFCGQSTRLRVEAAAPLLARGLIVRVDAPCPGRDPKFGYYRPTSEGERLFHGAAEDALKCHENGEG